jgi:hypothetical protein
VPFRIRAANLGRQVAAPTQAKNPAAPATRDDEGSVPYNKQSSEKSKIKNGEA